MAIEVLVTDRNLTVVGDPIPWLSVDATVNFNAPASGELAAVATGAVMAQFAAGNRVVVIRDGDVFCAGPYERATYKRSVAGDAVNPGKLTVHFSDDLALVAGRITYPDPSLVSTSDSQPAHWTATAANAEDVIQDLVDQNAGPGALLVRQIPQLVLAADAGVGGNVTLSTRWAPLMDVIRSVAIAGGGLGVRTRQVVGEIRFEVYEPADRSGQVRFGWGLNNLREVEYTRVAPTVTAAIVGGQGELAGREIRERVNSGAQSAWWRVETFVDQRQTSDDVELDQAGDEALIDGAESVVLKTLTVDSDTQRYGIHYGLGDRVSVSPVTGVDIADVVRAVTLKATAADGEQVTALVGTTNASTEPAWVRGLRAIDRQLARQGAI